MHLVNKHFMPVGHSGGTVIAVRAPNPQTNGARPQFTTTVSATLNGITGTMAISTW